MSVSAYSYDLFAILQVHSTLSLRCKTPNHNICVLASCSCWVPRHMLAVHGIVLLFNARVQGCILQIALTLTWT